jgi:hypothetical protein
LTKDCPQAARLLPQEHFDFLAAAHQRLFQPPAAMNVERRESWRIRPV